MKDNSENKNKKEEKHTVKKEGKPFDEHNNASATRGGTTDMDQTTGKTNKTQRGSGINTKRSVSGSDYDGQVSTD